MERGPVPKPSNRTDPWDCTEPIHIISVPAQLQMEWERFMATGNRKSSFISLNHKELYHVNTGSPVGGWLQGQAAQIQQYL